MIRPLGMPDPEVYPSSTQLPWNADQWGPLAVPARGTTIPINEQTLAQYERIITHHEGHKKVKIDSGKLWIDEQLLAT
ncbi:MAG: signal peptidase I, partial [Desulfobacterales bacterium]|nr:signal peptidase I [Desulfobacterales bacterium]